MYEFAIFAAGLASGLASYGAVAFVRARWARIDWDTDSPSK